jgi:S1-C subfamily serine protease
MLRGIGAVLLTSLIGAGVLAQQREGQPAIQKDKQGRSQAEYGTGQKMNRYIQVRGRWDERGFHIDAVNPDGPASQLMKDKNGKPSGRLEPGDTIVDVEGKAIHSQMDYANALTGAKDPKNIEIKVRDRNGKEHTWYVSSRKTAFETGRNARD